MRPDGASNTYQPGWVYNLEASQFINGRVSAPQ